MGCTASLCTWAWEIAQAWAALCVAASVCPWADPCAAARSGGGAPGAAAGAAGRAVGRHQPALHPAAGRVRLPLAGAAPAQRKARPSALLYRPHIVRVVRILRNGAAGGSSCWYMHRLPHAKMLAWQKVAVHIDGIRCRHAHRPAEVGTTGYTCSRGRPPWVSVEQLAHRACGRGSSHGVTAVVMRRAIGARRGCCGTLWGPRSPTLWGPCPTLALPCRRRPRRRPPCPTSRALAPARA
jgi:hypothetical protein